jgi:hypothetical protein
VPGARLAPAMISTSGHRGPEGANVEPSQPGCHPGKREPSRFEVTPFGSPFAMAQAVARTRQRRCFALSLALRLFARMVLLDFAVFFTWGSLDGRRCISTGHSAWGATVSVPVVGSPAAISLSAAE